MSITIGEALALGKAALQGTAESSDFDAEVLLCHVLETGKATLIAWPERSLTDEQNQRYVALLEQRKQGTPLAYLLGQREFWSLDLLVTPDVLIPRPDTELLVEVALELGTALESDAEGSAPVKVADLGTGSGAVALALCHEKPHWQITATDLSEKALDVARQNATALEMPEVSFRHGRWCEALGEERYHLIVSNPPYIRREDPHLEQGDLRFEPSQALVSGHSGLDDISTLATCARDHLHPQGWLALEHGYDQHQAVQILLAEAGYENIATQHDLSGIPRVTLGQRPESVATSVEDEEEESINAHPEFNDIQTRILGSLIEKSLSDPDHYPPDLANLQQACNQKAGRSPMSHYSIKELEEATSDLLDEGFIRCSTDEHQQTRYQHRLGSIAGYNKAQTCLLGLLMLRGPMTATELLHRSERLFTFSSTGHVEKTLASLATHCDQPCVIKLQRQPHSQEFHWMHTFGQSHALPQAQPDLMADTPQPDAEEKAYIKALEQRVSELEDIVAQLSDQEEKDQP